jgi:mercuric ion binding protein
MAMKRTIICAALFLAVLLPVLAAAVKTETIRVPTIQCGSCKHRIESKLQGLKGLQSIAVDVDTKTATVAFDPDVVTLAQIEKAIAKVGYDANETKANAKAQSRLSPCCRPGGGE